MYFAMINGKMTRNFANSRWMQGSWWNGTDQEKQIIAASELSQTTVIWATYCQRTLEQGL